MPPSNKTKTNTEPQETGSVNARFLGVALQCFLIIEDKEGHVTSVFRSCAVFITIKMRSYLSSTEVDILPLVLVGNLSKHTHQCSLRSTLSILSSKHLNWDQQPVTLAWQETVTLAWESSLDASVATMAAHRPLPDVREMLKSRECKVVQLWVGAAGSDCCVSEVTAVKKGQCPHPQGAKIKKCLSFLLCLVQQSLQKDGQAEPHFPAAAGVLCLSSALLEFLLVYEVCSHATDVLSLTSVYPLTFV